MAIFGSSALMAQSLIPTPFAYASCGFGVPPTGYVNCVGSPDCAASRCTVPAGCNGQAAMVFGESFTYILPTPLVVGQAYDIQMNVSTGHLGASSIIAGNHTFQIVGTTTTPGTCGSSSYGSICNVAGGQVLLTGTVSTIGWVNFTNTFIATAPITRITFTNCDNTGNGGNIFCSPSLVNGIVLAPVEIAHFGGQFYNCQVDLEWNTATISPEISQFNILRTTADEQRKVIGTIESSAIRGTSNFRFTDPNPGTEGHYQLEAIDLSGNIVQSAVVKVEGSCPTEGLEVLSNPITGNEATLYYQASSTPTTLKVYDLTGRMVYETILPPTSEGSAHFTLDVTGWKPGMYFLSTSDGELTKMYLQR